MFRLNKKALGQELKCQINLLVPGETLEISYTQSSSAQNIFDDIVQQLGLLDKDYFGLKFHDQVQWLDLTKPVVKQTKGINHPIFELRFKYYPADPPALANESTRYLLYHQLRLDLIEGRLRGDCQDTLAYLIACILQSELGDFSPTDKNDVNNYVADFKFVPNQTEELEWAAIKLHQNEDFIGLRPVESELNFLKKACKLDTYGIDPYPVKEGNSRKHFLIGVNHLGIATFQDSKLTSRFIWDEIDRITLDSKLVLIYCLKTITKGDKTSKSKHLLGFRCPSPDYAHNFWKIATEHRYFFTLETTPEEPIVTNTGGLFKKSHKLKYTGRVEKDLLRDYVDEQRTTGVKRSHSLMSKTVDGPRWHGFQPGNNLQTSLHNLYAADNFNKTMPADMDRFCEEDEDQFDQSNRRTSTHNISSKTSANAYGDHVKRTSLGSSKEGESGRFTRRPILTTKVEAASAIRRGSQIFMDTEGRKNDFYITSILLVMTLLSFLLIILLINDSEKPNVVSTIVKKLHMEPLSQNLRENYYLPLKSALRTSLGHLFSLLDTKLI